MVLIHQNLKYLWVYKYDVSLEPGTQAKCFSGGLFKWALYISLYTQQGKSNKRVILFICCCWVINYHKSRSLKQCILRTLQFMWGRGLNTAYRAQGPTNHSHQARCIHIGSLHQEESTSKLIEVIDRIHFLATVGLRALVSCLLLAWDWAQLLEATYGYLPMGFPNMASFFIKPSRRISGACFLARQSLV